MLTCLPLHLLLLALASYAAGAATLTPPPVSAPSDSSSPASTSATPTSSGGASATGTVNSSRGGNTTSTATSSAQFPSLSGLSSCANNCLGLAIANDSCTSYVDVNCYCVNATRFASGLVDCIAATCPGDLSAAEDVAEQFCAQAAASTSLSFPTPSFSSSASSAGVNASASRSSTSTSPGTSSTGSRSSSGNGAGSWRHGHGHGSRGAVVAGAVGLAGALLGVLFA